MVSRYHRASLSVVTSRGLRFLALRLLKLDLPHTTRLPALQSQVRLTSLTVCVLPPTPTMPRRSQTPEASKAQTPPSRHSPSRDTHSHKKHEASRRRSRSPHRDNDSHRHKRRRTRSPVSKPVALPYKAKPLSKREYETYKPLFQSYLDIQKQIQLDELDEREVKGRWKSFVTRWYALPPSHKQAYRLQVWIEKTC